MTAPTATIASLPAADLLSGNELIEATQDGRSVRVALSSVFSAGKSAYEIAQETGYTGTLVQWLATLQGAQGVPGVPGAPGERGYTGDPGARGLQGLQGLQGNPGPQGVQGTPGPQGSQGSPGAQGPQGVQGPQGTPGLSAYAVAVASGYVGTETAWLLSLKGATGAQGAQGVPGVQGAQGVPGTPGAQGLQGIQGLQGLQGIPGLSAYQVALANGFNGTAVQWLASLVGQQGAPGAQGATGATGGPGAKGDAGVQGPQGPTGAQGSPGATGAQGIAGLTAYELAISTGYTGTLVQWLASLKGEQGVQGLRGFTGDTGAQGLQGLRGLQGLQGVPGDTGPQGAPGPQGIQGVQGIQGFTGAPGSDADVTATNVTTRMPYDGGTVADILSQAKAMASYTALRAYTGSAKSVRITAASLAGFFERSDTDTTSVDDGGAILIDGVGRRWVRTYQNAVSPRWWGVLGNGVADDTDAYNACFAYASRTYQTISLRKCGTSIIGTNGYGLLYGSQSTSGQSLAPMAMVGEGWATTFQAAVGFTGTVLKAVNIAGVVWENFQLNAGGTATGINTSWNVAGPSTLCKFSNIRISGASPGKPCWSGVNNNDSQFSRIHGSCASSYNGDCAIFDFRGSGGLFYMNECVWDAGYLRCGMQNGTINNSWGMGIEFSKGNLNYVGIFGGYLYGNKAKNSILWSEDYTSFQSVHALECTSTQFIANDLPAAASMMNLSLYSSAVFRGCQFIGNANALTMFGANSRTDRYGRARVKFEGGSYTDNSITLNRIAAFQIDTEGFVKDTSQTEYTNWVDRTYAAGSSSGAIAAGAWNDLVAPGVAEGLASYVLAMEWNHNGAGEPFLLSAAAVVSAISTSAFPGSVGNPISGNAMGYRGNFSTATIDFRAVTGNGTSCGWQWRCSIALPAAGSVSWKLARLT